MRDLQKVSYYTHSRDEKNKAKQLSDLVKTLEWFGEIVLFAKKKKKVIFDLSWMVGPDHSHGKGKK